MANKGMIIVNSKDESRLKELSSYIWSLKFKKDVRVDVALYEHESLGATLSRIRYVVVVNPKCELEEIKQLLLKKGYITE